MKTNRTQSLRGLLLCSAIGVGLLAASAAAAQEQIGINIEPQPLVSALNAFGVQTGQPVISTPELTASKLSPGVRDTDDPAIALTQLLVGTGLSYRCSGDTYLIVPAPQAGPALARCVNQGGAGATEGSEGGTVEALIVTAQKREENIQDVPIAISAFSQKELEAQKIEGGFDLLKAIPNVTFSKNNFTSYNFSIRGVGTKAISATTDPGVAVAFNNTGVIQNRLFEQEYYDIERVEVLRGPQGTLYGRNATSGVINVISAKPDLNEFKGSLKGEVGNYDTKRLSAMVNVPLVEDKLAVRLAGALTDRQGYDFNSVTQNPVNGRSLWSARLTVGFEPTERFRGNLIWERFEEDDDRLRTGKQLCHRDNGLLMVGDTPTIDDPDNPFSVQMRPALFGQGCKGGNLYDDMAFGTPNGLSLPFIFGMIALGHDCGGGCTATFPIGYEDGEARSLLALQDPYDGMMQSSDLRSIASFRDPRYRAKADLLELNLEFDIDDDLTFYSQTAYVEDSVYSFQDFNRFNTVPVFTDTSALTPAAADWSDLAPGGVFCDPQLGCSNTLAGFDISQASAEQFSQEFRLQSDFDGPINFSIGANYTTFDVLVDYYIMYNIITALALTQPFNQPINGEVDLGTCWTSGFFLSGPSVPTSDPLSACPYIDPNPVESINGEGHNYFRSKNPYELESSAAFGELYWEVNDALKLTAGLRYTRDEKTFIPVPSQILLAPSVFGAGAVSKGYPEGAPIAQEWGEWTGRLGVDFKPDLAWTDDTMLYAFYSRGYKGGGANPPTPGFAKIQDYLDYGILTEAEVEQYANFGFIPVLELNAVEYGPTFDPEFVDAFEVGAKNTLLGGAMTFNATAFYYDYKDYQISQIRDRTAVNENFDAEVWGLEFETLIVPSPNLQIVANLGYLDTRIGDGETSIDIMDRTQSNPGYVIFKPWFQLPSNCVVPTHVAEEYLGVTDWGLYNFWNICGVGGILGSTLYEKPQDPVLGGDYNVDNYPELHGGAGLLADLSGNELPNAPHWTMNIGAQYGMDILEGWRMTVRGDAYWQSQSWHRVYNADPYDKLHGWYNVNLSVWIERPDDGLKIELYAKNLLDKTPITDAFLNSDDTGLTTNVFVLDPRLIGLSIRKEF